MSLDFSQPFTERTPRIVKAAKLHRAKERRQTQRFLVEGANAVEAAVATGAATDIFVTEKAARDHEEIVTAAGYMDVYTHAIDNKASQRLAETVTATGIYAVCRSVTWSLGAVLNGKPRLVVVGVETADPGNAGTLIRIADVCGADAVVFAGQTVDPESNKVARASAGSLFHVPVVRDTNVNDVLGQLRASDLAQAATTLDGEVSLAEAGERLAQPTAWLFGNEAHGLSDQAAKQADYRVHIPIRGGAESLNIATAAAMCLWESVKADNLAGDAE